MSQQTEPDWSRLRALFPVTRSWAYLNTGWSGPLSLPVVEAMRARLDLELADGPTTRHVMDDRVALAERFRAATARMLGADPDEIAITGNTTEGVNIALNGLDIGPGDGVVTTNAEHGGGIVPAYYLRHRRGADLRLVRVAAEDGPGVILERFADAIDERTRLVLLSEVSYSTGQRLPLAEIAGLARERGATVVVDGAQTAGHIPLDVHALGIDAYAVPSHKWLCGPDGLGALYVRRDRIPDIEPAKVSGRAALSFDHEGAFEPLRDKVTKFEVSTISAPVLAGTLAATELYLEHGPDAVFARAQALNRYAETRFDAIEGVRVLSARDDRARTGLFLFAVSSAPGRDLDASRVAAYLQAAGQVVARTVKQQNAVRLSLHAFNDESDIERAAEVIERAAAHGIPDEAVAGYVASEQVADQRT